MTITKQPNGNLEMALGVYDQSCFRKNFGTVLLGRSAMETVFIRSWLRPLGYTEIKPEDCGALTSAPLITDGKDVWGFMDYQVTAFLEKLSAGETITWQKG